MAYLESTHPSAGVPLDDEPPATIMVCPDCTRVDLLCECGDAGSCFVEVPNPAARPCYKRDCRCPGHA